MKRKTNLFYNSGQDSKFLTFSNYTEALTGNFLSTNTKLFPSTFLCLNIPSLTKDNKADFIKNVLIAQYENKLATLRDALGENILPLQYLIEYLLNYDANTQITYIGNITEQDYLGSFTDTICIIDTATFKNATITGSDFSHVDLKESESTLYGWYNNGVYVGPSVYANLNPVFDIDNSYYYDSGISINYNLGNNLINTIEFNVLIPLFTFVDIKNGLITNDGTETVLDATFNRNVPLGIWFADKTISLDRDNYYGQSWSLAIGSQFKPLPTSNKVVSDITKQSNVEAFNTFAQVLTRQNELLTTMEKLNLRIEALSNEIKSVKTSSSDVMIKNQLDGLRLKIEKLENSITQ